MENRLIQSTAMPEDTLGFNDHQKHIVKLLKENFKKELNEVKKQSKWHLNKFKTQ